MRILGDYAETQSASVHAYTLSGDNTTLPVGYPSIWKLNMGNWNYVRHLRCKIWSVTLN